MCCSPLVCWESTSGTIVENENWEYQKKMSQQDQLISQISIQTTSDVVSLERSLTSKDIPVESKLLKVHGKRKYASQSSRYYASSQRNGVGDWDMRTLRWRLRWTWLHVSFRCPTKAFTTYPPSLFLPITARLMKSLVFIDVVYSNISGQKIRAARGKCWSSKRLMLWWPSTSSTLNQPLQMAWLFCSSMTYRRTEIQRSHSWSSSHLLLIRNGRAKSLLCCRANRWRGHDVDSNGNTSVPAMHTL